MKMRHVTLAIGIGLSFLAATPGRARAQVVMARPATAVWSGGYGMVGGPSLADPIVLGGAPVGATPVYPYSYFAAYPGPARVYVGYGESDIFPYGGQPYGHPYDKWSWSYLAGYPDVLARYYYPPVR